MSLIVTEAAPAAAGRIGAARATLTETSGVGGSPPLACAVVVESALAEATRSREVVEGGLGVELESTDAAVRAGIESLVDADMQLARGAGR